MKTLPKNLSKYKQTPKFTEKTVPKGLLNDHNTKAGVWGKIVLEKGEIEYVISEPETKSYILTPDYFGVVEPEVKHYITPKGEVLFYVEFYK